MIRAIAELWLKYQANLARTGNFGMHRGDQRDQWVRVTAEDTVDGRCNVTITVDENDRITSVTVTGSGPIKPEKVIDLIKLGPVYNRQQIFADIQDVNDLYKDQGYSVHFGARSGPRIPTTLAL